MLKMKIIRPVYEDEAGKLYRRITQTEALTNELAVRGEYDAGGEEIVAWFVPLTTGEAK